MPQSTSPLLANYQALVLAGVREIRSGSACRLLLALCCLIGFAPHAGWAAVADFAGTYQGTFVGDDTGTWRIALDLDGNISGSGISAEDGPFSIGGDVDSEGNLAAVAGKVTTGSTYQGQIAGDGSVSGTWSNQRFGDTGTFSGSRWSVAMIVNVGSGLCLTGDGENGGIFLARCEGREDQRFDLADDGSLRIYGDLCLDKAPAGSGLRKGALTATVCDGSDEQAWLVEQKLSSRLSNGKRGCASVRKNGQAVGDLVNIRSRKKCKGRKQSQQFALIPQGSEVEQCFGSVGRGCARSTDLPKAKTGRRSKKGTQKIKVSVGTIAHDNCCRSHPNGYHCLGPDTGENESNCRSEWLQAERDLRLGRYWKHKFGPYSADAYSDDLTSVSGRRLVLPAEPGTGKGDSCDDSVVVASPRETAGSLALAAPKGTKLDCTDEQFCASGNARRPAGKDHIVCTKAIPEPDTPEQPDLPPPPAS
jgi:hypothetical protein